MWLTQSNFPSENQSGKPSSFLSVNVLLPCPDDPMHNDPHHAKSNNKTVVWAVLGDWLRRRDKVPRMPKNEWWSGWAYPLKLFRNPENSITMRSLQLGIPRKTIHYVLHKRKRSSLCAYLTYSGSHRNILWNFCINGLKNNNCLTIWNNFRDMIFKLLKPSLMTPYSFKYILWPI